MPQQPLSFAETPVVVIVSDDPQRQPALRAPGREVYRWAPDGVGVPGEKTFAGDPTDPDSWAWAARASSVAAVIELPDRTRAERVSDAVRSVRADAAVVILCPGCAEQREDGTLVRSGRLRDVLRLDLDDELQRIEAQRRVYCLREFARGPGMLPVLVHPDPDPDAVSSALAVRALLRRSPDEMPIVTESEGGRPENRRMNDLLRIRVTRVSRDELRAFERLVAVDFQPGPIAANGGPRIAVIDHHPAEPGYRAEYADIRPHIGATATMLTQYLRADDERRVKGPLATALLYGIKTDTDSLMRGVTPADAEAYAFLQARADVDLLRRFERGTYSLAAAKRFGRALAEAHGEGTVMVAYLGRITSAEAHALADLADFCLAVEGVSVAAACAFMNGNFVVSLRRQGDTPGAGELAREISRDGGSGGGHAAMARVEWPEAEAMRRLGSEESGIAAAVARLISERVDGRTSSAVSRRG